MAFEICYTGKVAAHGVRNAAETTLVDEPIADTLPPAFRRRLSAARVEFRGADRSPRPVRRMTIANPAHLAHVASDRRPQGPGNGIGSSSTPLASLPVAPDELTATKFDVLGEGQVRDK